MALEERTIACRALFLLRGALESQGSDLKAEKMSLKKLKQKLMQIAFSAPCKDTGKNVDRLSVAVRTGAVRISLKSDYRFTFLLAIRVSELCLNRDTSTGRLYNLCKQSHVNKTGSRL